MPQIRRIDPGRAGPLLGFGKTLPQDLVIYQASYVVIPRIQIAHEHCNRDGTDTGGHWWWPRASSGNIEELETSIGPVKAAILAMGLARLGR